MNLLALRAILIPILFSSGTSGSWVGRGEGICSLPSAFSSPDLSRVREADCLRRNSLQGTKFSIARVLNQIASVALAVTGTSMLEDSVV